MKNQAIRGVVDAAVFFSLSSIFSLALPGCLDGVGGRLGRHAPWIEDHPDDRAVAEGDTATFAVGATGSTPLAYQWRRQNAMLPAWADIAGATSPSYTTDPTTSGDTGAQFMCVVTNAFGTADSNAATLTVQGALTETYVIVDLSAGGVTQSATIADLETNDAYKTTHLVLKRIPAGSFQMGDQVGGHDGDELPVHTVNITQPFYMGVFEVTQEQWTTIVGSWSFYFPGNPKRPAEKVSWNDINESGGFMDTLSSLASSSGMSFRLPTEAEWEYCCKAGTSTNYSYGDTANGAWMWYNSNSGGQTHDVGTTTSKPNPWGLYDMHGNVYEWCEDRYGSSYYSSSPSDDPTGPASGSSRVLRGGPWDAFDDNSRSAFRGSIDPSYRDYYFGFRVAVAAAP